MKKIFLALLLLTGFYGFGQSVGKLRYDTVIVEKVGGTAELIIRNATKDTLGFLYNAGNGRTIFKTIPTSTGSGGLSGGNIGSAYRLYAPGSQAIKTIGNGYAVLIDSATTNTLTFKADTSLLQKILSYGNTIVKNNNTLYLKNDTTSCDTCTVGYKDGRFGTYQSYMLDTTGLSSISAGNAFLKMTGTKRIGVGSVANGLTIGTTTISSGTAQRILYEGSTNKLSETSGFTFDGTNTLAIPATGKYQIGSVTTTYLPDQTNFLNTIFYGSLPASLSHTSGITGQYNTGVGLLALNALTTGASTVAVGSRALQANTTGNNNVAIGDGSLITNTSGSQNTAVGMGALSTLSTGNNNTAIGYEALKATTGSTVTGIGYRALHENTTAANNVGVGDDANYQNRTGTKNTAIGSGAMTGTASNDWFNNTAVGYHALFTVSTNGNGNIAIGDSAAYNLTTNSRTITIGTALQDNGTNSLNLGGLIFGTGMTATGTSAAGNMGVQIATPREVLDVNGQVSVRTINSAAVGSIDSVLVAEDGRIKSAPFFASGNFTPTITGGANYSSSSSPTGKYVRVGNTVYVTVYVSVTATAGGSSVIFDISLPSSVTSNFTASTDAIGNGTLLFAGTGEVAQCFANTTDDRLTCTTSNIGSTSARDFVITATYEVK